MAAMAVKQTEEAAKEDNRAARFVALSGAVARAATLDESVRQLGAHLQEFRVLCEQLVPELLNASDGEAKSLLLQRHGELDRYLYQPAVKLFASEIQAAVGIDPRYIELAPGIYDYVDRCRREAIALLRRRQIERMHVGAGAPFAAGHVVDGGETPQLTSNPDWDGRVASVEAGNGGWLLSGQVVVPAVGRRFVCQAPG